MPLTDRERFAAAVAARLAEVGEQPRRRLDRGSGPPTEQQTEIAALIVVGLLSPAEAARKAGCALPWVYQALSQFARRLGYSRWKEAHADLYVRVRGQTR